MLPLNPTLGPTVVEEAYPPPAIRLQTPTAQPRAYPAPVPIPLSPPAGRAEIAKPKSDFRFFMPLVSTLPSVPSALGNVLRAGNFQQLSAWSCLGRCRLTFQPDRTRAAVRVAGRSARWSGIAQDVSTSIRNGGRYRSSVWLRTPHADLSRAWMVLEVTTSTGTEYFGTVAVPLTGGRWQQLAQNLNPTWTGDLQRALWRIEAEPATANLLVADASLQELPHAFRNPPGQRVQIFRSRLRQTITSVAGGNWRHDSAGIVEPIDSIGRFNLARLNHRSARVVVNLKQWRPTPDGDYVDAGHIHNSFQLMQILQERKIDLTVAVLDVPDWLVLNPDSPRQRVIDPNRSAEATDLLISWLQHAIDAYHIRIASLSFNEPEAGANTHWSPESMADFIQTAGPRLKAAGLSTQFLLGDCSAVKTCLHFTRAVWSKSDVHPHISAIAVHTWDEPRPPAIEYEDFGRFVATTGLPLIASEVGWDADQWRRHADAAPFSSWTHAVRTAQIYSQMLKLTGTSSTYYWQMLGTDFPTNDGVSAYPVFGVIKDFDRLFPPGAQIVETSPNEAAVYSLAASRENQVVLHLINGADQLRKLTVDGLPNGTYRHRHSNRTVQNNPLPDAVTNDGQIQLLLEKESIHVLVQQ